MAVITPSALISEIRGKVGAQFFSRNANGAFVGEWSVPTNPDTTAQQVVRNAMADGVSAWRSLPDANKKTWYDWAADQKNALSISRKISKIAYSEFVGRYISRAVISGSNTNINPYAIAPVLLSFEVQSVSSGSIVISYQLPAGSVGSILVVSASNAISAGIRQPSQPSFRVIETVTTASTSGTLDIFTSLNDRWPIDVTMIGSKVHLCAWLTGATHYKKSVSQFTSVTVSSDIIATPPYVSQSANSQNTNNSSLSISFPVAPSNGDLIVLFHSVSAAAGASIPSGFTQLLTNTSFIFRQYVFYKFAGASESNVYTSSGGSGLDRNFVGYCIRNHSGPGCITGQNGASNFSGTTSAVLVSSSKTYANYSLSIAGTAFSNGISAPSANNSFALDESVISGPYGGYILATFSRSFVTGTTAQPSASWTGSQQNASCSCFII